MKVALIGPSYVEAQASHMAETLEGMGHSAVCVDPERKVIPVERVLGNRFVNFNTTIYKHVLSKIPIVRRRQSNRILKEIQKAGDIDLTIVLHDFLNEDEVQAIKRETGSPVYLWFPDPLSNFRKSMFFVAGYDQLFFCDKYISDRLCSEFQLPAHFLPQCFNPLRHKRVSLSESDRETYACDITNAGNLYPSRAALYKQLTQFDIKMWGHKAIWLRVPELQDAIMGKPVYNEEKCKAFQAAKIVLNNMHPAVVDGINKRAFEIAGCGGFLLNSHRDAVTDLFVDGKEAVTYKTLPELIEKIKYYLDHEEERLEIVEAGHKRATKDHTYQNRLEVMFDMVGHSA